MQFGDQVPTGTYLDMTANLPVVDPKKVLAPVLMVRGEYDGNRDVEDLFDFYRQLPNGDRQFVILPNTAHQCAVRQSTAICSGTPCANSSTCRHRRRFRR